MKTQIKTAAFWGILLLIFLFLLEIALRAGFLAWYKFDAYRKRGIRFAIYQTSDPQNPANWILIPGFNAPIPLKNYHTKNSSGRPVPVKRFYPMQINQWGFRGPEFEAQRTPGTTRIMCLGDSCTFGNLGDYCYPRVVEKTLRQRGIKAEVINAGVEGYDSSHLLMRLPHDLSFKPEIATLYIGWNDLWEEPEMGFWERNFILCRIPLGFYHRLNRPKHFRDLKFYRALEGYRHTPAFLGRIRKIIRMAKASGARPALITLPSLFSTDYPPSKHALAIGRVELSGNAYLLAAKIRDYNQALRELAKEEKIPLLDAEAWSKTALNPREAYFIDSVHLNDLGSEKLGIFLAGQIAPYLETSALPGK